MSRILADLSDDDIRWLDARAAERGASRAALLREAVAVYREAARTGGIERYFGMWHDRQAPFAPGGEGEP
jgi:hypothetical protein